MLLFFSLELAICAVTIACYRNRRLRQFRVGLTRSACLGLLLCVTLYAVAVRADHAEFALLFIVFELTTALVFPWGAYNQALMGAACMISFAAFVGVRGVGDPALPVVYELYAVGAAALISVLGSAFLDRQRFALFAQHEQLDQHLATFRELTHAFRGFDPQLVVCLVCTSTLRSFGLERSWVVWRTIEDGSHGYLVRRDEDGDTVWGPLIDPGPLWTWVAGWPASERAFLADDTDQQMPVSLRGARVGSLLCISLQFEGEHLGAICADRGGRPFSIGEGELALASVLAGGAAIALANARLYQQVTAASEEKSVFLARISHELRNPLQAILWDVDAVQDGAAAGPRVDRVRQNALMTLDLARALQDFAEVETMQVVASPEPVNVAETLDNLRAAAMSLIEGRPITFHTRVSADARVLVTDPFRLRQILGNLISNAAKFTARGSIEVEAERAGTEIAIAVRDTGVGIEESEAARIFMPFYRGSARAVAHTRGMGLGLAIARDLASLLGGHIEVESAVGRGSTFRLFLPDGAAGLPAAPLDESPIARVLLIEDDARCRAQVAEALRHEGSTVIEAGEGSHRGDPDPANARLQGTPRRIRGPG